MKEIKDILEAFDKARLQGKNAALATVVHVEGSSYRRPGARMLVTEDGQLTGAISGGCLEGDALRKALYVMQKQKTMLVTYDTSDEDDAKLGIGLGCNGVIQVLIEPINLLQPDNPIQLLRKISQERTETVITTLFSLQNKKEEQPGTCLLLQNNEPTSALPDSFLIKNQLTEDMQLALVNKKSYFRNYISTQQNLTAFIEYIKPPVSLVVVGAGKDVVPLIIMAEIIGWQTTVIAGRGFYAKKERFAGNCNVLLLRPEELADKISIDKQTAFVLMSHNYNYEYLALKTLINTDTSYIGLLGPRKKSIRMIDELKEEGILLSLEHLKKIYGPAGLDIGAETPEEIALSILSEIKAVLCYRNGNMLREKEDVIHPRSDTYIEEIVVDDSLKQESRNTSFII
ncbi:MAG TPA: XdhC/CoxI family protein [Puia sp.]|nr:XdhC/CoxI family protein [Puia sp.]